MLTPERALEIWSYMMECEINSPDDLIDKEARIHWHFVERRYSVSLRASNGRWYVVRDTQAGNQLFFGKLVLQDARFVVQPAGAKKTYETGKRNVHAHVIGTVKKAQFQPERVYVPCGMPVMYSHNLYPEPEFKVQPTGDIQMNMAAYPPIHWCEMLACGTDPETRRPMMLAAGKVNDASVFEKR